MDSHSVLTYDGSKKITMLAAFVALGAVFKISLAVIPNVELLTFWVFILTMVYGLKIGFTVGVFANFMADLFIGFGPWTPFICMGFGLVAIITHFYKKTAGFKSKRDYIYCGILVTVAFDLFTVITATWLVLGVPLLLALYMQYGIMPPTFYPFGIVHTVSNALLFSILGVNIIKVLKNNYPSFC
ncbi:MAG: ECF transporter S component [Candidatus Methanofastidiosia archaeon]